MIDKISNVLSKFIAIILALLVLLIVYDASARYLFSSGSTALQELEWHFFDVVILLSISYALKHNAHVRVDIFYDQFSLKIQTLINILSIVFFILPLSFLIFYMGVSFVEISYVQDEMSCDPGGLSHRWIVKSLMPLSFGFLALQAISLLLEEVKKWRSL
ncbi:TRAP transporter small permease subunit [Sulfurimonas sp. SAG-AH-194-L11]|nr:TRAP transporter small permease subunit [Sulfurimonas sp. SAG-AH-194-L11]MDF1876662.1 TRAP transporter small permease subunit [Sulfurimonas sp. SAG-AH-194-L11]